MYRIESCTFIRSKYRSENSKRVPRAQLRKCIPWDTFARASKGYSSKMRHEIIQSALEFIILKKQKAKVIAHRKLTDNQFRPLTKAKTFFSYEVFPNPCDRERDVHLMVTPNDRIPSYAGSKPRRCTNRCGAWLVYLIVLITYFLATFLASSKQSSPLHLYCHMGLE